ncbi:DUF2335 domain-containing protein [Vallicoccus soli]|uniref:DUF2335 domain-containing protein n=1 Tax=Vallicoccus soli TaxID=2339232 RepID=UPI001402D7C8|nr:DUF2335 domain-containing protein [Vallicoccus soli]
MSDRRRTDRPAGAPAAPAAAPAPPTGPLPSPDAVQRYEQVLPGAADRIMKLLESQSEHRMDMETALVEGALRTERLGQVFGLGIVVLVFAVSAWLIDGGHGISGTVLGVTDLVALIAVFLRGRGDTSQP